MRDGSNSPMAICTGSMMNIDYGAKYECKKEVGLNMYKLIINNVSANDSGIITCTEDEGRGPGRNSSRLHVLGSCKYSNLASEFTRTLFLLHQR